MDHPISGQVRILVLASNSIADAQLNLDSEVRAIEKAIRQGDLRSNFDIHPHLAVEVQDLQDLLLGYRPHMVHFCGHGSGEGQIVLKNEYGDYHVVPTSALAELFSTLSQNIRCVVLNSCYSEPQADAIAEYVDCVIGVSGDIGDKAAIAFSTGFYRALAYGENVERAFQLGCNELNLKQIPTAGKPRLIAKHHNAADVAFLTPTADWSARHNDFGKQGVFSTAQNEIADSDFVRALDVARYLEELQTTILNEFHQDQYVTLNVKALESEDFQTLLAIRQAILSSFDIRVEPQFETEGKQTSLEEAIGPYRLVALLGDPGSGKTTSLRFAALAHSRSFSAQDSTALPIWISLSRWDDQDMPATEFLWREFLAVADTTQVELTLFEDWIYEGRFAFLLDGLNELPQRSISGDPDDLKEANQERRHERQKIDFRENSLLALARESKSRFILSCRTLEYTHLPGWREFRILPLNEPQIADFVEKHLGNQVSELHLMLQSQPSLRDFVRNPFLLRSLIALIQIHWGETPKDRFQLVQFTCQSALERESAKRGLKVSLVLRHLGSISYDSMSEGWIGSSFTTLFKMRQEQINEETEDISTRVAIECGVGAGLLVPLASEDDQLEFRYRHQLIQEALALLHLKFNVYENDEHTELRSLVAVGDAHLKWNKLREAQENYQRALELCPTMGEEELRASILLALSRVYRYFRKSRESIQYAELAVSLLESIDVHSRDLIAQAYLELGTVYERLRAVDKAEACYLKAVGPREGQDENAEFAFRIIDGIADLYASIFVFRIKDSIFWFTRALAILEKEHHRFGIAYCKYQMADAWRLWGDYARAKALYEDCSTAFEDQRQYRPLCRALLVWGNILDAEGDVNRALRLYQRGYLISQNAALRSHQISILVFGFANTAIRQGQHLRAIENLREAEVLARQQASPAALANVYLKYAEAYATAGRHHQASMYLVKSKELWDDEYRLHTESIIRIGTYLAWKLGIHADKYKFLQTLSQILWSMYFQLDRYAERASNPLALALRRFYIWSQRFWS